MGIRRVLPTQNGAASAYEGDKEGCPRWYGIGSSSGEGMKWGVVEADCSMSSCEYRELAIQCLWKTTSRPSLSSS